MDNNPDFKSFYSKIQVAAPYLSSVVIPLITVKNIKSGHYYITAFLEECKNLRHLQIVGTESTKEFSVAALKAFAKGIHNNIEKGGQIEDIEFGAITFPTSKSNEVSEKIFGTLNTMTNLKTLTTRKNNMFVSYFKGAKALSKMIISHKYLRELNLQNVGLDDSGAKDLADGFMRAKQLEILNLSHNSTLKPSGLTSIIYNLAFSPKLVYIDISHSSFSGSVNDFVEALYKLLRISASLEVLDLSYCGSLNINLPEQFFIALGEVRTLRKLDISNSGPLGDQGCINLGKAIAFNARKLGVLEYLNLDGGVISSYDRFKKFFEAMSVNEADHETWYGDANKVSKMSGQDFAKVYYNNLKNLQINKSSMGSTFDYAKWKKGLNPIDPPLVQFLARSKNLTNVQLGSCNLSVKDADMLYLALDPKREHFCSNVKILNLSCNKLGKEGVKVLSQIFVTNNILEVVDLSHNHLGVAGAVYLANSLTNNKSVKFLNLFANKIDVDGARAFEKTLKENSTLEFIDFGHNRLRHEGLRAIANGISSNKTSKVKTLGLRFNFIDSEGIITFFKKVFPQGHNSKLESIYIRNNSINEFGLYDILRVHEKLGLKLHVDLFDKLKFVESDILDRTIWIHPAVGTSEEVKNFFEISQKCGIVLNIRKRTGPRWPNRKRQNNEFYFVEFASAVSVTRALHVASRKLAVISGTNVRIYKAGSGTYNYTKPKKKVGASNTNYRGPRGRRIRGGNRVRGGRRR